MVDCLVHSTRFQSRLGKHLKKRKKYQCKKSVKSLRYADESFSELVSIYYLKVAANILLQIQRL